MMNTTSLGLRLKLHDGVECITTVTRAFIKTADTDSALRCRISNWVVMAKHALRSVRPRREPTIATFESRSHGNTPIGKPVWLAATNSQIGVIPRTYDTCPRTGLLPYPVGFEHDLSLITGPNLPRLVNPPGTPTITGWGDHEEVLRGDPLFLVSQNVLTEDFSEFTGQAISRSAQEAIATSYAWDREITSSARSLLWRTVSDGQRVMGASGSVLCLGRLNDEEAKAIVFQNVEGPLDYTLTADDHRPMAQERNPLASWKAGFLPPHEIRESEIQSSGREQRRQFPSVNAAKRSSEVHKRNFTG